MDAREALNAWFDHAEFRPHQEEIIGSVLAGCDTLGVLPTGAGKSLCYQLPALLLPRPTLVISPLIALMKDQLDGLPPAVYPQATLINSSVEWEELERRTAAIEAGEIKLIYAAPERLRQQRFLRLLQRVGLSLVVVDEAHCVGVWGHDFRPDYLFIRKALESLASAGHAPTLLALTATATPEMQTEIAAQLGRPLESVLASAFRPNLRLEVVACSNANDKMKHLAAACRETPGATIVYANSRDRCEQLAAFLRREGLKAAHYHAGLEREERQQVQEQFMLDRTRIMVATVAFGMGVDKPNVRMVAHFSLPTSLEAYTQEAGRAGRDGKPSRCLLLYAAADKTNLNRWMRQEEISLATVRDVYRALQARLGRGESGPVSAEELQQAAMASERDMRGAETRLRVALSLLERCGLVVRHPDSGGELQMEMLRPPPTARADLETILAERRRHAERRVEEMVGYVTGNGCRHVAISQHFGQTLAACGSVCDCCLGTAQAIPEPQERPLAPTAAQVADVGRVILETMRALPFSVGRTGLAKILSGAQDSPIKGDRCPTYGTLAGFTLKALRAMTDALIERDFLRIAGDDERPLLALTAAGRAALADAAEILPNPNTVAPARPASRRAETSPSATPSTEKVVPEATLSEDEDDRFERLRVWRRTQAQRLNVPPYVIFHDSVLRAIAQRNPDSLEAFRFIAGIGPRKLETYGEAILALLNGEEPAEE